MKTNVNTSTLVSRINDWLQTAKNTNGNSVYAHDPIDPKGNISIFKIEADDGSYLSCSLVMYSERNHWESTQDQESKKSGTAGGPTFILLLQISPLEAEYVSASPHSEAAQSISEQTEVQIERVLGTKARPTPTTHYGWRWLISESHVAEGIHLQLV